MMDSLKRVRKLRQKIRIEKKLKLAMSEKESPENSSSDCERESEPCHNRIESHMPFNEFEDINNDSNNEYDSDKSSKSSEYSSSDNDESSNCSEYSSSDSDESSNCSEYSSSDSFHNSNFSEEEDRVDYNKISDQSSAELRDVQNQQVNEEPEIKKIKEWAVKYKIPGTHLDPLLKILKQRLLPKIPLCSKTLLQTSSAKYTIEMIPDSKNNPSEFAYLGIEQGLRACVNNDLHPDSKLQLDFNIDGAKMKKSSKKTLWPILCKVFYKPLPSVYAPFTVAMFYGVGKPKDINEYLDKFIDEINKLLEEGIVLNKQHFEVEIRAFICDTPARALLKCTKNHQSFHGCEKCDHVAKKCDRTTVFLSVGRARTDSDFRNFEDVQHHDTVTPLINIEPPIDLIKQFIIDIMHLFFLGVILRMFEYWYAVRLEKKENDKEKPTEKEKTTQKPVKKNEKNPVKDKKKIIRKQRLACNLSTFQLSELDRRTQMITKDIPKEFKRQMRSTDWYHDYKASEHRFFSMYIGPLVLKDILQDDYYNHFMLFHVATRMLSSNNVLKYTTLAKKYLADFVNSSKTLYNEKFVTLNTHNLNHVTNDAEFLQSNLMDASGFPYENELGKIKRVLRSPHRSVAQYCRRIHEEKTFLNLKAKLPKEIEIVKENKKKNLILTLNYKQQFFSTKHPNNTAILKDKSIVRIKKMFKKDNEIYLTVMDFTGKSSVYTKPCNSSVLDTFEINDSIIVSSKRNVLLQSIQNKMVKTSFNFSKDQENRTFVIPMLH